MTSQFPGPLSGKMLLMKRYTLSLVKHILVLDDLIFSAAFISSFTFLTSSQAGVTLLPLYLKMLHFSEPAVVKKFRSEHTRFF